MGNSNDRVMPYQIICLVVLGSGILKSLNIHAFAMETGDFIDLYMPSWLHGFQYPCAMIVCCTEMMLGLLGLKTIYKIVALYGMLLLMSFFVWLTAVNAFFPTILGSVESCGCFGELIHFTPVAAFVKSIALWVIVAALLLIEWRKSGLDLDSAKIRNNLCDWYIWISVLAGWILVLFSYFFVNRLSHEIYLSFFISICLIMALAIVWYCKKQKETC